MSHKGEIEHTCVSQEKDDNIEQVKATANETPSQVETHKVDDSESVVSTTQDSPPVEADSTQPRKSERTRTLTEKGQALADARLKDLKANFKRAYERWKHNLNGLKKSIKYNDDSDLMGTMSRINTAQVEIDAIYLKIRDTLHPEHPDSEIRRMNDTCQALSKIANKKAQQFLKDGGSEISSWPDNESVFETTASNVSFSLNTRRSKQSSHASQEARQAAAEAAATKEVLKIMKEQSEQEEEIRRLEREDEILTAENEAENAKKRALFIAESADRKTKLEEKRREVERLEELKKLNAAKAKLKVYSESVHSDDEEDNQSLPPPHERAVLSLPPQELLPHMLPAHQPNPNPASQAQVPQPCQAIVTNSSTSHAPIYTSVSVPQPATLTHASTPTLPLPMQQAAFTHAPPTHTTTSHDNSNDLVRTLAEAITANRIPIPEPAVFTGDPLKYNDWKLSFSALIDRKNLPVQEKLFFLRKYVSSAATKAIEGHFLVGTESAYLAAWTVLEDRFGDPFLIGKSYRDKIHAWRKIGSKDNQELREFADFLSSVESAMPYVQGLQVLNDCVENQRIAAKLPDWCSSRWNRTVVTIQDETNMFPDFKVFVSFLRRGSYCLPPCHFVASNEPKRRENKVKRARQL